ncbi:hypothetical protein EMPS_08557 [Entomortierella parvispora]|uniref:Uncharacterized protein n=1 Tax=Entomortierella parvispora TaxID=205924 RepID=A0A9P3HGM5_9FUNG|nr:hypothetical protein EMPS_08557 [Entomortierella parvispora]
METSALTILLFFIVVFFLLAAFLLYIFISRRSTPVSQRLTLWLKAQSEADQLVETMAAQAQCVIDGLRPFRRRNNQRKLRAQRRHHPHLPHHHHHRNRRDTQELGDESAEEDATMDEIWRRHQRQRLDRAELQMEPTVTSYYPSGSSIGGGGGASAGTSGGGALGVHAVDMGDQYESHGDGGGGGAGGSGNGGGSRKKKRPSDELDGERLWEFVVGWCMVACIFIGIALIIGANIALQNRVPGEEETPWTFETEEGDSLMDNVMTHIMQIAMGIRDFEDQLMEHGIFVFVVGINGYLLVRQRVYSRRREYERELMQGDTQQLEMIRRGAMANANIAAATTAALQDEEKGSDGWTQERGEREVSGIAARGYFEDAGYDEISKAASPWATFETDAIPPPVPLKEELQDALQREKSTATKNNKLDDPDGSAGEDDSPDFRTMSFLAWFNYLQVGIVIIEFLQLFSFPLRELMEFYNQAEKTSTVYESAKDVLNAFRTVATNADQQQQQQAGEGLHYGDGKLSFGNMTLYGFKVNKSKNNSSNDDNNINPSVETNDSDGNATTSALSQQRQAIDWLENMPMLDNATAAITPWIQESKAPMEWITENLPAWLPNITALLANSTMTDVAQKSLEGIRDQIIQAATNSSLTSGINVIAQAVGDGSALQAGARDEGIGGSSTSTPPSSATTKDVGNDGDIVMQVVNSLGLQPSINTHDWYLLRFWSCFAVVLLGWVVALCIHGWNRRCRRLRREGKPHWGAISVGWISCFIPVVSVLYLPILSTFLSSASCQSQAIHAYAHERHAQQEDQACREGHGAHTPSTLLHSIVLTLLDPASTVSSPPAHSLLCTGPQIRPSLYLGASLLAYTLAYLLFMVFLTSFERVPAKGEICSRPNGVAVLKNLGLLLAVDFLLIQSPAQRRFRGLVSIAIMLAMACYTIRMKPCYWNKINYWRTFSFSCVLYASLLVALLCQSPEEPKGSTKGERIGGKWVMAPHLKLGHAWTVGGGPKVMLAWIAAGWAILIIVFVVVDRVFLKQWTKRNPWRSDYQFLGHHGPNTLGNPSGAGGNGGGGGGGTSAGGDTNYTLLHHQVRPTALHAQDRASFQPSTRDSRRPSLLQTPPVARAGPTTGASTFRNEDLRLPMSTMGPKSELRTNDAASSNGSGEDANAGGAPGMHTRDMVSASSHWSVVDLATPASEEPPKPQ